MFPLYKVVLVEVIKEQMVALPLASVPVAFDLELILSEPYLQLED